MHLCGGFEHTMDENGRIIIPSKLREGIGEKFYLCVDLSNDKTQLEGMSVEDYEIKAEIISSLYADEPEKAQYFFQYSLPINVDKQGRVVIPEILRMKVGLGPNIIIIGMMNKFIIKNQSDKCDPDSAELREFNRKVSALIRENKEKSKA